MKKFKRGKIFKLMSMVIAVAMLITSLSAGVFAEIVSKKELARDLIGDTMLGGLARAQLYSELLEIQSPSTTTSEAIASTMSKVNSWFSGTMSAILVEDVNDFLVDFASSEEVVQDAILAAVNEVKIGNPSGLSTTYVSKFPTIVKNINSTFLGLTNSTSMDGIKFVASLFAFLAEESGSPVVESVSSNNAVIIELTTSNATTEAAVETAMDQYVDTFYTSGATIDSVLGMIEDIVNASTDTEKKYFKHFVDGIDDLGYNVFTGYLPSLSTGGGYTPPPPEDPADEPADEPAEEPAEEPTEEPAEEPAEEPTEEPTTEEPTTEEPTEDTTPVSESITEEEQQAVNEVSETTQQLATVETEEEAVSAIDNVVESISNLTKEFEVVPVDTETEPGTEPTEEPTTAPKIEAAEATVTVVAESISTISTVMDKVTTEEQAQAVFTKVLDTAKTTTQLATQNFTSSTEVEKAVMEVAEKLVERVNQVEAPSNFEGEEQNVSFDDDFVENLEETMTKLVQTVAEVNKQLEESAVEKKVETVLEVSAQKTEGTKKVTMDVPSELFEKANEKGVDKVSLGSSIAKVSIKPSMLKLQRGQKVNLAVENTAKEKLSAKVKEIAGDDEVFDFKLKVGDEDLTKFDEPVDVSIPYTPKTGQNAKFSNAFYIDDEGTLVSMKAKYNAKKGTMNFKTKHFSYYTVKNNPVTFMDLTSVEWAREMVEEMASKGIINGMSKDNFAPNEKLTRAQFVTLLVNAFDIELVTGATPVFDDVTKDDWFYSHVYTAYKEGLVLGVNLNEFAPNANITRQDMTVMIRNAWEKYGEKVKADTNFLRRFKDAREIKMYALESVALAIKLGVIKGRNTGDFDPAGLASRAEAAVVINKVFNNLK